MWFHCLSRFAVLGVIWCALVLPVSAQGTPDIVWMTKQHTSWVNVLSFTADGSLLASGSEDTTAKVYRASDGALVRNFAGAPRCVD